ncbi:MBOAT family O-acyltransferase [Argonema galeatum]|uniref:MBOAT family O-acyltransferase n=1 Tax=Argonema galeatum TaxID=2942762 RepID=UPI002010FBB3|nr:MBOAT family protein [Argonema galeatum]MCL1464464.1 MBOAT family protein [Argonema galeatum A003/A1]
MVFNYQMGRLLYLATGNSKRARILIWVGLGFNLLVLAYYKYANFFITSIDSLFNTQLLAPNVTLPLAISFFTFTQSAYLVDAYRGETKNYNFLTYGLFVLFFPHLIAGPIVRHNDLVPQFEQLRNFVFSHKNMAMGLTLFTLGLAKKVLIADNISPWVAPIFAHASDCTFIEAWVGALSYTFQLYFDFSGYSDMAIGLGWMMNIDLPINFDSPYKATSIIDFWRRWHITLSNFLRDYLYIPLGGSRRGELRRYTNLMITMLLGGLWHGAGWTFVVWGGWHGLLLSIDHAWRKLGIQLPKILAWTITFIAVVFGWVLFRAQSIHDGIEMVQVMLGMKNFVLPVAYQKLLGWLTQFGLKFKGWQEFTYLPPLGGQKSLWVLGGLILGVILLPNTQDIMKWIKPTVWWALLVGSLAVFCLVSLNRVSEFLYFRF